jgi:nucleotide-binding universal stress UspA family protein
MTQQIVVPLDGSLFAEQALPFAASLARRFARPAHARPRT